MNSESLHSYHLRDQLNRFDGKHTAPLEQLLASPQLRDEHLESLISFIENDEETIQIGSSWILLNHSTYWRRFDSSTSERVLDLLASELHWQASLHLLRLAPRLTITADLATDAYQLFLDFTQSKRPFLRAWAYDALIHLAKPFPDFKDRIQPLLDSALRNEKPSVAARIRQSRQS